MRPVRHIAAAAIACAVCLAGEPAFAADAPLTVADVAGWDIRIPRDPHPAERHAAEELRQFLQRATGIEPPIREGRPLFGRHIILGPSRQAGSGALSEEEHVVRISRRRVVICGGSPRGTLYGVYQFAEDRLGARFLTPEHTHVPRDPDRPLSEGESRYAPPFRFRWGFSHELNAAPWFAARLRNNPPGLPDDLGGPQPQAWPSHTLHYQVPPSEYAETHPEYFALVDGQRMLDVGFGGGPQVDPTRFAVADVVAAAVRDEFAANPGQLNAGVGQNDNPFFCECDTCTPLNESEGTAAAAQLFLVNFVARQIALEYPGKLISTLAYWYTRRPPAHMAPLPNVQIQLCAFEASVAHAIADSTSPLNAAFMDDFAGWRAATERLYIWHYVANLQSVDAPTPGILTLGDTLRAYRDRRVLGFFMQGNGRCPAAELSDLRGYVVSQLMWNPDRDAGALIDEFLALHYGPAAPPIRAYIDLTHAMARDSRAQPATWSHPLESGLTPEYARRIMALFDEALALAPDDTIRRRVEKASLPAYKALIEGAGALTWDEGEEGARVFMAYPPEVAQRIAAYPALAAEHGLTRNAEFQPLEAYLADVSRNRSGAPAVRLENAAWRLTFVPFINASCVEMRHKPSGRSYLQALGGPGINLPAGTLRFGGLAGYDDAGPSAFTPRLDDDRIVFVKDLPDGSVAELAVRLDGDTVRWSARYQHRADAPRDYRFFARARLHAPRDNPRAQVFLDDDGWRVIDTPDGIEVSPDTPGNGLAYYLPGRKWGLLMRYEAGPVAGVRVVRQPALEELDVTIATPLIPLRRGGRFTLDWSFRPLAVSPLNSGPALWKSAE